MGSEHSATITKVTHSPFRVFGEGFTILVRLPVVGSHDNYIDERQSTAILVIEVSDTSLVYDRTDKERVYKITEISEYWIVNLSEGQVEVRRKSQDLSDAQQGCGYKDV